MLAALASVSAGMLSTAVAQTSPGLAPNPNPTGPNQAGSDAAEVQEVVVTAQKRTQNLEDVPLSVTVANAQLLQDANVRDIKDLQVLVPGLVVTSATVQDSIIARIRGVGTVGSNVGLEDSVGIQVDGVYRPRTGVSFGDIGQLDQIEVLKGPQGTLFGKNTDAGLINIITAQPSYTFGAAAEFTAGNYNEVGGSAQVTGPLLDDKVAGSLFFAQRERDGFQDVSTGAGPRTDRTDQDLNFYTIRGQLAFDPQSDLHARLIADYTRRRENGDVGVQTYAGAQPTAILNSFDIPGGATLPTPDPGRRLAFANRSTGNNVLDAGVSLQVDYKPPGLAGAKVTSITAYRDYVLTNGEDSDYTAADLLYRPDGGASSTGFKQFSEELRLSGAYANLDYDVGGFYANELLNSHVSELFGANFPQYLVDLGVPQSLANLDSNGLGQHDTYNQNDRTFSFFTQETYHVTRKLELTGGIRFTQDHKFLQAGYGNTDEGASCSGALSIFGSLPLSLTTFRQTVAPLVSTLCNPLYNPLYDGVQNRQNETENEVTGTAKIGYHVTPESFAYASYSRGYKAGGFNLDRVANPFSAPGLGPAQGLPVATPTTIANSLKPVLDTGFGGEFVNDYEIGLKNSLLRGKLDLNAAVFYEGFEGFQLNAYNGLFFTVVSVPNVFSFGADFDALYRPTRNLTVQGGVTYANTRFPRSDSSVLGSANQPQFAATNLLPGQRLPEAPLVSLSASATYEHPVYRALVGRANVDVKYNSSVNTGTNGDPLEVQGQYALVDARLGIGPADKRWSVEIYAQNLFNTLYSQGGFGSPFQTGSETEFLGEPRTFGGTLRVRY